MTSRHPPVLSRRMRERGGRRLYCATVSGSIGSELSREGSWHHGKVSMDILEYVADCGVNARGVYVATRQSYRGAGSTVVRTVLPQSVAGPPETLSIPLANAASAAPHRAPAG